jgi:hypothetical protein
MEIVNVKVPTGYPSFFDSMHTLLPKVALYLGE